MAIHWFALPMNLTIAHGHLHTTMEAASSTMFLRSVSPLVSFNASPKHPQSFTGSAIAIHTVMAVITVMKASISLDTSLRRMAKSRRIPSDSSTAACSTEALSVR